MLTSRTVLGMFVLEILLADASVAQVNELPANSAGTQRPRIGLVLGGGAAKGAAHIGVLEVLDELRVPVDCIAGTSMGALVGATLAAGKSPQDIERSVVGINWSETLGGQGLRNETPINRKLTETTYSNTLDFGVGHGGLRTPPGLIKTQQIEGVIRTLVSGERYTEKFDDLPIPFRAVATDMVSGNMVILESGDLSIAMRASMAVPGAFAPVRLDGMVLADGGMTRNLPVDVARDLCADVVIAVWLTTPPPEPGDLASALSLVGRSLDVMIDANQKAQIATLSGADVGISVPMGDIGSGDFDRAQDAIALGREAAESNIDALRRLAVGKDEYAAWASNIRRPVSDAGTVSEVRIVGLERVNPAYVRAKIQDVAPGKNVNVEQVAERVFSLGDFEHVGYRVTGPADQQVLEIDAIEKSWGPNFLRFDLGIAANGNNDLKALLRADHYLPWVNTRGGTWHNMLQVGQQALVTTDFYQPLDLRQRFFVQPSATFQNELEDIYIDSDRIARYYFQEVYGQIDAGMNFGTRAQARVGIRSGWNDADLDTGIPGFPEVHHERDASVRLHFAYDTRDSVGLPTRGAFLNARYVRSKNWFGSDLDYELVEGVYSPSYKFRGKSLSLVFGGGSTLSGDPPAAETFQLGGIRTFPGLRPGELRGTDYWLAGARFLWQLTEIQPMFGQAIYAGLRIQAGEVTGFSDDPDGTLIGISGSLGGRTPVGPFLLSLGYVDNDSLRLQFTVGRPVDEGSILDEIQ